MSSGYSRVSRHGGMVHVIHSPQAPDTPGCPRPWKGRVGIVMSHGCMVRVRYGQVSLAMLGPFGDRDAPWGHCTGEAYPPRGGYTRVSPAMEGPCGDGEAQWEWGTGGGGTEPTP